MIDDEPVPSVVVAWAVTLAVAGGLLLTVPPSVARRLGVAALLASPLVAVVVDWRTDDRRRAVAFGLCVLLAGALVSAVVGVVRFLVSPAAVFRLRVGLPLFVLVVARVASRRLTGWLER